MSSSSLQPPPPRPPSSAPPPPAPGSVPVTYTKSTSSSWRDESRPPSVPYPDESRWGLGDAAIATLIYFFMSVVLALVVIFVVDTDPLDGPWFPITLIVPQVCQLTFVIWTARRRGSGLGVDLGLAFQWKDVALGAMLFIAGLMAAGLVVQGMDAVGIDPPTSAVADLTEEAVDGSEEGGIGFDVGDVEDEPDEGSGITVWIVMVAILAATVVPVTEELGYRGLWYSALAKRGHPEWWALGFSSFIFAIVHLEPARTPVIFVLGAVLGWGRMVTNRIGASIIAHGLINGVAFAALLAELS